MDFEQTAVDQLRQRLADHGLAVASFFSEMADAEPSQTTLVARPVRHLDQDEFDRRRQFDAAGGVQAGIGHAEGARSALVGPIAAGLNGGHSNENGWGAAPRGPLGRGIARVPIRERERPNRSRDSRGAHRNGRVEIRQETCANRSPHAFLARRLALALATW